jgi:hypothetical protein
LSDLFFQTSKAVEFSGLRRIFSFASSGPFSGLRKVSPANQPPVDKGTAHGLG